MFENTIYICQYAYTATTLPGWPVATFVFESRKVMPGCQLMIMIMIMILIMSMRMIMTMDHDHDRGHDHGGPDKAGR